MARMMADQFGWTPDQVADLTLPQFRALMADREDDKRRARGLLPGFKRVGSYNELRAAIG